MLLILNIRKYGIHPGGLSELGGGAFVMIPKPEKNQPERSCSKSLTQFFWPITHRELALSKAPVKNGIASTKNFEEENWPLRHNVWAYSLSAGSLDTISLASDVNSADSLHRLDPYPFFLFSALPTATVSVGPSVAPWACLQSSQCSTRLLSLLSLSPAIPVTITLKK